MDHQDSQRLIRILKESDTELMQTIFRIVSPHAENIADIFYRTLQEDSESANFLDHKVVNDRLRNALASWVLDLLTPKSDDQIDAYVQRQIEIGDRHARINVPLTSLHLGASLLKQAFFKELVFSGIEKKQLADAIIQVDQLIDYSLAVMNRVYIGEIVNEARHGQSLKLQAVGYDMALQSESLRASLFDWHRRVLRLLLEPSPTANQLPRIANTDFGLWVLHKGNLLFPDSLEVEELKRLIGEIQDEVEAASLAAEDLVGKSSSLNRLDELVVSATTVLSAITDQTLAQEGGRDPLTKLFNRRFLRTIMQREVRASLQTGERFAVLLVDADHFKSINDTYGHDAGDMVLRQLAERLLTEVRAGDFVFRYGGEEFLVLLSDVTSRDAGRIAEKIRAAIEENLFVIPDERSISVTASLGVAVHDGHPDYSRTITQADEALYRSKEEGRNRWTLGDAEPES